MQDLDDVEIICYDFQIYVPQSLRRRVIYWYHLYINHPGGSRLAKTIREICYWKVLVMQAELFTKTCKICQQFKKKKTIYGHLSPKNIAEIKPWDMVHVDLLGSYTKSIRQHKPGGTVIHKNASTTCMKMIDPSLGWFEFVEIPTFDLKEVAIGNDEYIDKSSARVSCLCKNTWLCRYPRLRKVMFGNISEFKQDFTPLLKDFNIKPVWTSVKSPQANATVEILHQAILNMLVTKDLDNKVLDYIDIWSETLASIAWDIIASYYRIIMATPDQAVFGIYMLLNLASVVDWRVATAVKQRQVDIDNVRENAKRVTYD